MSNDRQQFRIAIAGNVFIPAYLALQKKGYTVTRKVSADGEETWVADGRLGQFQADNTVSLLGLVAMAETRGESWQAHDDEIDAFLKELP